MSLGSAPAERRVTAIIPAYNRAAVLPRAIDSVLAQSVADQCDIIIVDDGSTDDTAQVVGAYGDRVRYLRQENQGAGAARNTGIVAAATEFIAFLDSDDIWLPDKTERQLAVFAQWPQVVLVAGKAIERRADGTCGERRPPDLPLDQPVDLAPTLFELNCLATPAIMVRRTALQQVGLFHTGLSRSQDYHLWTRLACCGPVVHLSQPVAEFAGDTRGSLQSDQQAARRENLRARRLLRRLLRARPDCRSAWRRGIVRHLVALRDAAFAEGRYAAAALHGLESFYYQPWSRARWEWARLLLSLFYAAWPLGANPRGGRPERPESI